MLHTIICRPVLPQFSPADHRVPGFGLRWHTLQSPISDQQKFGLVEVLKTCILMAWQKTLHHLLTTYRLLGDLWDLSSCEEGWKERGFLILTSICLASSSLLVPSALTPLNLVATVPVSPCISHAWTQEVWASSWSLICLCSIWWGKTAVLILSHRGAVMGLTLMQIKKA